MATVDCIGTARTHLTVGYVSDFIPAVVQTVTGNINRGASGRIGDGQADVAHFRIAGSDAVKVRVAGKLNAQTVRRGAGDDILAGAGLVCIQTAFNRQGVAELARYRVAAVPGKGHAFIDLGLNGVELPAVHRVGAARADLTVGDVGDGVAAVVEAVFGQGYRLIAAAHGHAAVADGGGAGGHAVCGEIFRQAKGQLRFSASVRILLVDSQVAVGVSEIHFVSGNRCRRMRLPGAGAGEHPGFTAAGAGGNVVDALAQGVELAAVHRILTV